MTETEPKNGKRASLLRRLSQPVDLTAGTPWRVILRYAVPIMISYLLQQIYVLTDAVICGQVLSAEEVAGVNDTFPLTFIFLQFAFGCTAGFFRSDRGMRRRGRQAGRAALLRGTNPPVARHIGCSDRAVGRASAVDAGTYPCYADQQDGV